VAQSSSNYLREKKMLKILKYWMEQKSLHLSDLRGMPEYTVCPKQSNNILLRIISIVRSVVQINYTISCKSYSHNICINIFLKLSILYLQVPAHRIWKLWFTMNIRYWNITWNRILLIREYNIFYRIKTSNNIELFRY